MLAQIKTFLGPQDMTEGKPLVNILKFSIPLLIGNFAQQLYSTVDSIVVGKYVGDTALSAIGTTFPIINMLLILFMTISTGVTIMIAQYFGARAKRDLAYTAGNAIILIALASVVIMAIGIPFARDLLVMINTPSEIIDMAQSYFTIIIYGVAGSAFYNIISGILRGLGDSFFPLCILIFTAVLNTVLDLWFVAGLGMGVAGAALATILTQGLSAIFCIIKLISMRDKIQLGIREFTPKMKYIKNILRLGLPAGVSQAIMSLSMVFVQALTNTMGYQVVTTMTAVMRIDGFAMLPNFTFGMAISTYVGQNVGAQRMDRVKEGSKVMLKLSIAISAALVLALLFFSRPMLLLFTDTKEIVELGVMQIRILAIGYIAVAFNQVFVGIMRGAGDTLPSMWISLITTVAVRTPLAYILAALTKSAAYPNGNPTSLFISLLTSWILGGVIAYFWYRAGKWKDKALIKSPQ